MNSKTFQPDLKAVGTSLWVIILSCSSATAAQASHAGHEARQLNSFNGREWRALHKSQGGVPRTSASPDLSKSLQQDFRQNRLPGQVSPFRANRPESFRHSTYMNAAGVTRSIQTGLSLDLSSTDATITVGRNLLGDSSVSIDVGDSTKEIKAGSMVTAAEYAALNQQLSSGKQDLKLNDRGAAINGSLNLNVVSDNGKSINTSALVIPEGVAVVGDFGRHADGIRVQNDLVNYGSLYAESSNRRGTAIIGARDVDNFASGLITTDISKSVASTLGISRSTLDLAVRADRDLNNQGQISSSGSLELSAGRSINNSGQALAAGNVSLNSATINNTGLISSANGNLNIVAPTDANLTINAVGGEFSALNGNINVDTTVGVNPKTNTTMLGGDWHANNLNITSGDGRIVGHVEDTTAMVNMKAGSTSFGSNGALLLGTVDCSGDPLLFSQFSSVTIGANQVTGGAPLAIIAGTDITVAVGVTTLDTSSAAGGGTITIVAGANLSSNPGVSVTINGGGVQEGFINLSGLTTIKSSASGAGNANGGNINIIAYGGFNFGQVIIPTTLLADGAGSGTGGNILVIGDANAGNSVTMQGASSSLSTGKGGNIQILSAQSGVGPPVVIDASAGATQGAIIAGNFSPAGNSNGAVSINSSIITNGGNVTVSSNGAVDLQAISTSSNTTNTSAGTISVTSSFNSVTVNSSLSAQGNGTGNGGTITVNGSTGVTVSGNISSIGGATGKGADITLSSGGDIFAFNMNARGGATSGDAGNISVQSTKTNGTITLNSTNIFANSVVGAGGNILIGATAGRLFFQDNALIMSEGSTASGNVTLTGNGAITGGIATITGKNLTIDCQGAVFIGDITLNTDGTHGLTLPAGNINFTARDILLNLGSAGITTSGASTDSGSISMIAARNIVGGVVPINTVPTAPGPGGNKGGDVTLTAGPSGLLTIGAIDTSPSGTNLFPGVISLTGGGGGLILNGSLKALSASQLTGTINITADLNLNVPQINTAVLTINNSGSITTTADVTVLTAQISSSGASISIGNDASDDLMAATGIILNASTSISQVGTITTKSMDISFNGAGTTTLTVSSPSLSNATLQGTIPNGKLVLNLTNAGALDIGTNMSDLKVQATGAINLNSATNVNSLNLEAGSGKNIAINGNVTANLNGIIRLKSTDGNIVESGAGLQTSGTGFVALTLDGATANASLGAVNSINSLTASGTAITSILTVNNGSNPITINGLSGTQSLTVSTTDAATGVVIGAAINTTGLLQFDTPRFFNDKSVSASSILIENLSGNLAIVGGAAPGGILSASTPLAGPPGSPSSPSAINIVTQSGANLDLFGKMVFNGDVTLNNNFGTTTSKVGSQFDGNNNVTLKTSTWNTAGSQITGNIFIFEESGNGNIVNSQGAINFNSNITLKGHDITFVALTDINITGPTTINLSSNLGPGGSLTMLAGYEVTPASIGQQQNALSYTFTATPSAGNINANNLTINTSATGAGNNSGDVVVIANGGSVQLGAVNATSGSALGGSVVIVGEKGVTVGDINNTGGAGSQAVFVESAKPQVINTPQLDNGTISGGAFFASPTLTAFNVALGAISSSTIIVKSGGIAGNSINVNGALNANSITLDAGLGDLKLNASNNLVANATAGVGGTILLSAGSVIGTGPSPITLTANGTTQGGNVGLTLRNPIGVTLGINPGDFTLTAQSPLGGGSASVTAVGDITVNANGINTKGTSGSGASNTLISQNTIFLNDNSMLNVNGTGANSDGGFLKLQASDIVFSSTVSSPLIMSANGTGTGAGGSIIYITTDTTPVFIGTPAKSAKGAADFLNLSARGGITGGNGGLLDVEVSGTLFVDSTKADASPQAGTSDGARYKFKAGTSLVVNGALNGNGINGGAGGSIELDSNSKTAFVVNTGGKAPKNGTSGPISVNGTGGAVIVRNLGGGVSLSSLTADNITLQTGLKGAIAVAKGAILTANNSLILQSDTGAIGKKPLTVVTPFLQATTNSAVNINDTFAGLVVVGDSNAGKGGFTLTTSGDTQLNDINVVGGSILVTGGNAGTLTVQPTSQITAQDGSITLNNPDAANGSIDIFAQANIATSGAKGDDVIIAIGAVPKKGISTSPIPANFDTDPQGTGKIFFDGVPNGVQVMLGPDVNPLATAINKNVIFSNLTTGVGLISVQVGATITADPPIVEHTHSMMLSQASLADPAPGGGAISSMSASAAQTAGSLDASQVISSNVNLFAPTVPSGGTTGGITTNGTSSATTALDGIRTSGATMLANGFANLIPCEAIFAIEQSAQEDVPAARTIADLFIDAAFHGDVGALSTQFSIDKNSDIVLLYRANPSNQSTERKSFALNNGNILFAPKCDTTIETPHGTVSIKANTLALVMQSHDRLAVFDVDDQSKNAVVINTNGKRVSLSPGQSVVVSSHRSERFEEINPIELVQYRRLNKTAAGNGLKVYTSEFSIPSVCFAVKPLRHLTSSTDKRTAAIRSHMLKTAAVVMMLRPDQGDYVQFFRPLVTALSTR